jgi:outer membrane receptor protein involved in Fe transport
MTIRPNKVALSVVLALGMAAATNQALAQQTAAPAANTAAEEDIEVISISRKRPESIQEVPIATTALSEKDIESAGIVRTGDFISLMSVLLMLATSVIPRSISAALSPPETPNRPLLTWLMVYLKPTRTALTARCLMWRKSKC